MLVTWSVLLICLCAQIIGHLVFWSNVSSNLNLTMANLRNKCVLGSYNCRSVKNSTAEVLSLCFQCDIICLQEHWLLPDEVDYISNIHSDFLAVGQSAVDTSSAILVGRPYGGTAIMYRKNTELFYHSCRNFWCSHNCCINMFKYWACVVVLCLYANRLWQLW